MQSALAGVLGIPTIMISGDSKAAEEAQALLGDIEVAVVKEAVGMESGICLASIAACQLIKEKAKRAVERSSEFEPFRVDEPVELKIEYSATQDCDKVVAVTGVERLDDHTVVKKGEDPLAGWRKYETSQGEVDLS